MRANKEVHTGDMKVGQRSPIILPDEAGEEIIRGEVITPLEAQEGKDYMADLAFAEEPMTIRIERSSEKNAPKVIECWANGKGAEVFIDGRWVELECLPVGVPVTTKRKYAEIIARAKTDSFETDVQEPSGADPINRLLSNTSSRAPFSVIKDDNPRGTEWLTRLLMER